MTFSVTNKEIDSKVKEFQIYLRDVFGIIITKEGVIKFLLGMNNKKYLKSR